MRKVIYVESEPFKFDDKVKQQIQQVIEKFDAYLDEYPVKNSRSKHALMGPVAKVLERAQKGEWEVEPLVGYALRVHEMNPKTRGIRPWALENLEQGTRQLLSLCQDVPVLALNRVVEQVDYGLYYALRKKGILWQDKKRRQLVEFLKKRYPTDDGQFDAPAFTTAWQLRQNQSIDTSYYFGPNSETYRKGNAKLRADMDAFYKVLDELGDAPNNTDDEEDL